MAPPIDMEAEDESLPSADHEVEDAAWPALDRNRPVRHRAHLPGIDGRPRPLGLARRLWTVCSGRGRGVVLDLASIPAVSIGGALVQRETVTREHLQAGFALAMLVRL